VSFEKVDVLNSQFSILNFQFDVIVSNPPYICNKERAGMERNVLEHEPELALFVPDDDPLLFYRAIARYAARALKPNGQLFFEINPLYADEMQQMLCEEGFSHIEVRNDQFGKQRFTKSCL
jgi:release factor glutamine methyltransferase